MDERVVQFRVGVMVLATLIITAILVVMFGRGPSWVLQPTYRVSIRFPEAPGVNEKTPIRKSGIVIGRVVNVRFADAELQRDVLVEAEIRRDVRLFSDEECQLIRTLVGDSRLEITTAGRGKQAPVQIEPQGMLTGVVVSDPTQAVGKMEGDIRETVRSVGRASEQLRDFVAKVDGLMGPDEERPQQRVQIKQLIQESHETLQSIKRFADNANSLLGGAEGNQRFRDALQRIPSVIGKLDTQLDRMTAAIESMQGTMSSAKENLDNLKPFTRALGQNGETVTVGLANAARNFDGVLADVRAITARLNSQEGSLGKLINDPSLYDNLNRTVVNLDTLSRQFQPIVNDVRVFTDKIARHPEELGVRGAIQRNQGTKW